jgi:competence protein ComEA
VIDAVNAAGGYREDADRVYVNQAEYVYDAERVSIPTAEEAEALKSETGTGDAAPAQSGGQSGSGLININTASKNELMEIPGIGESKAERIISYRENHGRFGSVEEIRNVSGIGSGIYEGLKDHITVE